MLLEALQDFLRIETRIGIVESGDEAERDDVVLRSVDPGAAVFTGGEGPSHGVDDFAFGDPAAGNFPQLFDADAVSLGVAAFVELEALDELLGAGAASAFGEDDDLGVKIVAGF